jgi:hypothetical protein
MTSLLNYLLNAAGKTVLPQHELYIVCSLAVIKALAEELSVFKQL